MGRIVAVESVTLDGVMQAPGRADEDGRGGFVHGGWAAPYADADLGRVMGEHMAHRGAMLLGHRTYDDFASYWPSRTDNPFTPVLNARPKYVVSRSRRGDLSWENSTLLTGEAHETVARLETEDDLTVLGSGELVRSLARHGLVDEYLLLIHPLVLGTGRRLFADGATARLRLVGSVPTSKG